MMRCPSCSFEVEVERRVCPSCGRQVVWESVDAAVRELEEVEGRPQFGSAGVPGPAPLDPRPARPAAADPDGGWQCQRCERLNPALAERCVECDDLRPVPVCRITGDVDLTLPWGTSATVGRAPSHSSSGASLTRFANVSRDHVLVEVDGEGQVQITDLQSLNGTWLVLGSGSLRRVPAGVAVPVTPGMAVQLGNDPVGPNARLVMDPVR